MRSATCSSMDQTNSPALHVSVVVTGKQNFTQQIQHKTFFLRFLSLQLRLSRAVTLHRTANSLGATYSIRAMTAAVGSQGGAAQGSAEQPAASDYVTLVLVTPDQLASVKTDLELNHSRQAAAHKEARAVLDHYANGSEPMVRVDMATKEWWRDYVASHEEATEMADVGITGFSIQSIVGVKDPNRNFRDRVDFIVRLADGTH